LKHTEIAEDGREARVAGEWHEETFCWRNESWEGEYSASFIVRSRPVTMFEERIEDTTDSKGWFNDIRDVFIG
jgi:hypothetical protein